MKRTYLGIIIATLILVSSSFVSACIVTNRNQAALIFPSDTGINMDVLENYCTDENCKILSDDIFPQIHKTIIFKIQYEGNEMIFVTQTSQDSETSPEINSLKVEFLDESPQVKELTSLELRLLIANDVIYGITAQDVNKISDIITTGNLVYFKPSACGDSYLDYSGGGSDEGKSDWLLGGGNCMVETFEGNCPQIGCYKCGTGSSLVNLNLISLSLTNSPIAEYIDNSDTSIPDENTDSNYMYWIIGLIIIIIITAILFFVKKKK